MRQQATIVRWDWPRAIGLLAGCYALGVGIIAILGWALDLKYLAAWDGGIAMQPNTALSAMFAGMALTARAWGYIRFSALLAVPVALIGGITLLEHLSGVDFAIDRMLLFGRDWAYDATMAPGRMGPPASTSYTLVGLTLLVAGLRPGGQRVAPPVGLGIVLISMLSLIGYIFRADAMYSTPESTAIAMQTATVLFTLGIGLIVSFPEQQPLRLILERSAGGIILRRALPFAVVLPIVAAWLRMQGEMAGVYSESFGRALLVLLLISLLVTLLWYCALVIRKYEQEQRTSEVRFTKFMQSLPGLAWIKDLKGRYIYANEAALRAFGKTSVELYGRTDSEVFPPEVAEQFRENDRLAVLNGSGIQTVETLQHTDGVMHHSIISKFIIPGHAGAPAMIGGVAIDITDRIQAEQALREADRRKDEFLATLAHELRNPLAPISNSLEMLKRIDGGSEMAANARSMMERQVTHMRRLIDDLMDVSRITQGKLALRREKVDIRMLVQHAAETCMSAHKHKQQVLTLQLPENAVWVEGDPVRLEQIFGNILNNACKYTDVKGTIAVTAKREDGNVSVYVKDNGMGIAPEMLGRVFEMFTQAHHSWEQASGGLGIGLSLVSGLVKLHGGEVSAHSEGEGKGSEFRVHLPAADAPDIDTGTMKGEVKLLPLENQRILVVDDNKDAAQSLALLFELQGHDVEIAYDGEEAVKRAMAFRPDIVMLDIGLPKMDGYEVCRELKRRLKAKPLVLALTGWGQQEDRRKSKEAGFDAHLVKPLDHAMLVELFKKLLSSPPVGAA